MHGFVYKVSTVVLQALAAVPATDNVSKIGAVITSKWTIIQYSKLVEGLAQQNYRS